MPAERSAAVTFSRLKARAPRGPLKGPCEVVRGRGGGAAGAAVGGVPHGQGAGATHDRFRREGGGEGRVKRRPRLTGLVGKCGGRGAFVCWVARRLVAFIVR